MNTRFILVCIAFSLSACNPVNRAGYIPTERDCEERLYELKGQQLERCLQIAQEGLTKAKAGYEQRRSERFSLAAQAYTQCINQNIGKYKKVNLPPETILTSLNGDCSSQKLELDLITADDNELRKSINSSLINRIVSMQYLDE